MKGFCFGSDGGIWWINIWGTASVSPWHFCIICPFSICSVHKMWADFFFLVPCASNCGHPNGQNQLSIYFLLTVLFKRWTLNLLNPYFFDRVWINSCRKSDSQPSHAFKTEGSVQVLSQASICIVQASQVHITSFSRLVEHFLWLSFSLTGCFLWKSDSPRGVRMTYFEENLARGDL